jgi:hypothetical protein
MHFFQRLVEEKYVCESANDLNIHALHEGDASPSG